MFVRLPIGEFCVSCLRLDREIDIHESYIDMDYLVAFRPHTYSRIKRWTTPKVRGFMAPQEWEEHTEELPSIEGVVLFLQGQESIFCAMPISKFLELTGLVIDN
jgi:hypothetical protein